MNIKPLLKNMKSTIKGSLLESKLLHNKIILYIVLSIVLVNLIANTVIGNYRYVSSVFLIGFLLSQFTKNMTVILLFALLLSNLIVLVWNEKLEGFEGADTSSGDETDTTTPTTTTEKTELKKDTENPAVKEDKEVKKLIDDKDKLVEMKKDAEDLLNTQKQILDGLNKIEPLLTRAEVLSEKFSNMNASPYTK